MNKNALLKFRPPTTGLIAGSLVFLGVLLFLTVSKALLVVAGLGAFGPGILREMGWLNDQDEFERQTAYRAGYHAYLVGGLTTVLIVSLLTWQGAIEDGTAEWLRLILIIFWFSWLFSALFVFWGAPKTASRILRTFGAFWAAFVILSLVGEAGEGQNIGQLLLGILTGTAIVSPFFILAWTASRWPATTGKILLVVALALFILLFPRGNLSWATSLLTYTLLLVPMVGSAIALLRHREDDSENEGDAEGQ